MREDIPWHYLRPNDALRYPRRHICLDTEAIVKRTARGEKHTFRCAVASFDRIDSGTLEPASSERHTFTDTASVWEFLTSKAVAKERTIVWAHNLAYDLRVSAAFDHLPAMGWQLAFLTLDSQRCVARWVNGSKSLTMTDTSSWFPGSLEKIAAALDLRKAPLPDQDDSEEDWVRRCDQDVTITREAVLWLLRYLESNDLGSFRLTGPAQSMGAYRHRFMPKRGLLVHRDMELLEREREAAYTGRCEAYRWGEVNEPLEEWDFQLAYLHLAATLSLPVRYASYRNRISLEQLASLGGRYCVLVEAEVRQSAPLLPAVTDNRILWPVGTFAGCYWDSELLAAVGRGASADIKRAWLYRKSPVLREWAEWTLARLRDDAQSVPPLEKILLKHWARALIGRFGLRYPVLEKRYDLPYASVEYVPGVDVDTGEDYAELQVGKDVLERSGLIESASSMPAVMSYVMACARIRLLEAMEAAGNGNVIYADTDAIVTNTRGGRRLSEWVRTDSGRGLRRKGRYTNAHIRGPRSLSLGNDLRVAGLPARASANGAGRYNAEVWEGLSEALRAGHASEVHVKQRSYRLRGTDHRRRHLKGGQTAPFVIQS